MGMSLTICLDMECHFPLVGLIKLTTYDEVLYSVRASMQ